VPRAGDIYAITELSYRMSPLGKQTPLTDHVNRLSESSVNKELTVSAWVGMVK
jgi:hypothetical protein